MALTLSGAETFLRQFVTNGNDTTQFPPTMIQDAILMTANDFVMRARVAGQQFTLPVTSGTTTITTTLPTNFRVSRLASEAYLTSGFTDSPLIKIVPYSKVLELQNSSYPGVSGVTSKPEYLAFPSDSG